MDRSTALDDRSTTLDGGQIYSYGNITDPSDTDPGEIGQNPAPPSFWLRNPLDLGRLGKNTQESGQQWGQAAIFFFFLPRTVQCPG